MESIQVRTADGVRLVGAAHHSRPRRAGPGHRARARLHGHGRRPHVQRVAARFARTADVVMVDFRGHGRSEGRTTAGDLEVLDVDATVRWAREAGYRRVATVGFSMGGAVVLRHAARSPSTTGLPRRAGGRGGQRERAVALVHPGHGADAPGALAAGDPDRALAGRGAADQGRRRLAACRRSGRRVAGRIAPTPVLIVQGDRDPYFGVEHGRALAAAAGRRRVLGAGRLRARRGRAHARAGRPDRRLGGTRPVGWHDAAVSRHAAPRGRRGRRARCSLPAAAAGPAGVGVRGRLRRRRFPPGPGRAPRPGVRRGEGACGPRRGVPPGGRSPGRPRGRPADAPARRGGGRRAGSLGVGAWSAGRASSSRSRSPRRCWPRPGCSAPTLPGRIGGLLIGLGAAAAGDAALLVRDRDLAGRAARRARPGAAGDGRAPAGPRRGPGPGDRVDGRGRAAGRRRGRALPADRAGPGDGRAAAGRPRWCWPPRPD